MQIWELSGTNWTLPILVEPHEDTAFVTIPEIPLLRQQRAMLENVLSQLATGGTDRERVIPMPILIENARQTEQPDAESVVVWGQMPSRTLNLPDQEGCDEFIADWLVSSGLGISKISATTIFVSLVTHMNHWLVNRRKPINLLFATLDPFQYRKNWKEILLGMAAKRAMQQPEAEWPNVPFLTQHKPTPAEMCFAEMISYQDGLCNWTVECTPTKWFHQQSSQVEAKRKQRLGGKAYAVSVCRTVMSHVPRALETYRKYLNEITAKITKLPEFVVGDSGYFGRVEKESLPKECRCFRAFVLPPDLAVETQSREQGDAPAPDGELP